MEHSSFIIIANLRYDEFRNELYFLISSRPNILKHEGEHENIDKASKTSVQAHNL